MSSQSSRHFLDGFLLLFRSLDSIRMSEPSKKEASVTIQEPVSATTTTTDEEDVEVKSGMSTWKIIAITASVVTVLGLSLGLGLGLGLKSDDPGILNFNS